MYTRHHYERDVRRAWQHAKPRLKKGVASPFRAALSTKPSYLRELGHWLLMLACIPQFLLQLIFYSVRLALGK